MVCNANDAHVWSAPLDQPADMIAKLAPLLSQDEYQRAERFHHPTDNCWSRKESYIKAIGMGVSYPLDGFTVSLGVAPALLRVDADATEAVRWKMYGLDVAEGYAAALIVENPPVSLSRFDF